MKLKTRQKIAEHVNNFSEDDVKEVEGCVEAIVTFFENIGEDEYRGMISSKNIEKFDNLSDKYGDLVMIAALVYKMNKDLS